jgi:hypothetical protein
VESNFENLLNQKVVYALYLWNRKYIVATQNLTHVLIIFFQKNKKIKIYIWQEHRASGLRKQYVKEIITESYIITTIS